MNIFYLILRPIFSSQNCWPIIPHMDSNVHAATVLPGFRAREDVNLKAVGISFNGQFLVVLSYTGLSIPVH